MSEQIKFFQNVESYTSIKQPVFTGLPKGLIEQIKVCNAVYQINFPVKIKDEIKVIEAYRVQHSHHKLPTKVVSAIAIWLTKTK